MDIDYRVTTVEISSIPAVTLQQATPSPRYPAVLPRGITASFTGKTVGFPWLPQYYRRPHYRAGLYFRDHMHDKINKAYAMLGIIKRNFNYLTITSFVLLYKSMVRSHLDYCSSVWVYLIKKVILSC